MKQELFVFVDDKYLSPKNKWTSTVLGWFIFLISAIGLILIGIKGKFDTGFPGDWNLVLFFIVGAVYIYRGFSKNSGLSVRFIRLTNHALEFKLCHQSKARTLAFSEIRTIEHDQREFRVVTKKEVIPLPFSAFGYGDIQTMKKHFAAAVPRTTADVA